MDNVLSKGLLLTVATALVGYGAATLQINFWNALLALIIGAAVYVGREVLKKRGYTLGKKK